MRKASIALLLALSTLALTQDPQDGPDSEQDEDGITDLLAPFTAYREAEQKKMDELLAGSWRLARLETPTDRLGTQDIRGFAMFDDGYASLVLMGQQVVEGFLTLDELEVQIQAGIYRYQVSELGTLQTASIMGFSNPDALALVFDRADEPREFIMDVTETELRLNHPDGHWLIFTRMQSGSFPVDAMRALERERAGRNTVPDYDPEQDF